MWRYVLIAFHLPEDDSFHFITYTNPNGSGHGYRLTPRPFFNLQSKHSPHFAFVAHRLGLGLPELHLFRQFQSDGGFLFKVVKRIVKQILFALDYMDPECGISHR